MNTAVSDGLILSAGERRYLRERLALALAKTIALLALIGGVLAYRYWSPWLLQGQLVLVLPLLLAWSWLLRRAPSQFKQIWTDLQRNKVSELRGAYDLLSHRGIGLLAPMQTQLRLGHYRFDAGKHDLQVLLAGVAVTVRYAPLSLTLLTLMQDDTISAELASSTPWSPRERQMLTLLAAGFSDKLIARELQLSPATVRTYNLALFRKLGVTDRKAAVQNAQARGLLNVN